jgi:hypothetical protein
MSSILSWRSILAIVCPSSKGFGFISIPIPAQTGIGIEMNPKQIPPFQTHARSDRHDKQCHPFYICPYRGIVRGIKNQAGLQPWKRVSHCNHRQRKNAIPVYNGMAFAEPFLALESIWNGLVGQLAYQGRGEGL